MTTRAFRIFVASGLLGLAACGGGGGGGGDGGNSGDGPPPPDPVTFQVTLTDLKLVDRVTDENIEAAGLPISGATASLEL